MKNFKITGEDYGKLTTIFCMMEQQGNVVKRYENKDISYSKCMMLLLQLQMQLIECNTNIFTESMMPSWTRWIAKQLQENRLSYKSSGSTYRALKDLDLILDSDEFMHVDSNEIVAIADLYNIK